MKYFISIVILISVITIYLALDSGKDGVKTVNRITSDKFIVLQDPDQKPVPGAIVKISCMEKQFISEFTTGSDGCFELPSSVKKHETTIVVTPSPGSSASVVHYYIPNQSAIPLVLPPLAELHVTVVDQETIPVEGAEVKFVHLEQNTINKFGSPVSEGMTRITDKTGKALFSSLKIGREGIAGVPYSVHVFRACYKFSVKDVEIHKGENSVKITITKITQEAAVTSQLINKDGTPLSQEIIDRINQRHFINGIKVDPRGKLTYLLNKDGREVVVNGVLKRRKYMSVWVDGIKPAGVMLQGMKEGVNDLGRIELEPGYPASGIVVDQNGQPHESTAVWIIDPVTKSASQKYHFWDMPSYP